MLGQTPERLYGEIPKDVPVYRLPEPLQGCEFGAVWLDNQWQDIDNVPTHRIVEVVADAPWLAAAGQGTPRTSMSVKSLKDAEREPLHLRKSRLENGWKKAEFVAWVGTNKEIPVKKEELRFAEDAQKAEQEVLNRLMPPEETPSAAGITAENTEPTPNGFVKTWGGHILLTLVTAALIAVVVKFLVLES